MVFFDDFYDDFYDEPLRPRPTFNAKDKEFLYSRQKGKCNGCEVKFPLRNMTVDHIKPFSQGGSDKPSNLQLLCNSCNSTKGDGTQAYLKKRLMEKGIVKAPKAPAKSSAKATTKTSSTKAAPKAKAKASPAKATSKTSSTKTAKSKSAKKPAARTTTRRTR